MPSSRSAASNVNTSMCEHFPYTRQQLFHLVRIGELKTFDDLLAQARHAAWAATSASRRWRPSWRPAGTNSCSRSATRRCRTRTTTSSPTCRRTAPTRSCRACRAARSRPTSSSSSAQVAKKYGLYTKITGGQRIDLFGAQVHQLPLIWKELIDAGFESGHAYGKALRTVKSCVGSTWCRYGVQDSVGLAIDLENRYKGLRAPHKIKFAVSGCTRECAEAQSKDVGVIATERGWNLYVCGNGGMKPRHADLLARDLDTPTLIRYIDRYPDVLHPHRPIACSAPRPGSRTSKAASTTCARWCARTRSASAPSSKPTWRASSAPTPANGRVAIEDPADAQALPPFREQRTRPTTTWCSSRSAARSVRPAPRNA